MSEQPAANDSLDYERIGRFIYAFHRICGTVDALTEAELASNAPPELAKRAATLAQTFQCILKDPACINEAALESTLREAAEVQAAIEEWRSSILRR